MSLTASQINMIAEIISNLGYIFFASVFLGPLLGGGTHPFLIMAGLFSSIIAWYFSINLVK